MAEPEIPLPDADRDATPRRWRPGRLGKLVSALLLLLAVTLVAGWIERERIADRLIASQLESLDLPATYQVVEISPRRQVLSHVVVGDPARPDLTVERIELTISTRWGWPYIGRMVLIRPRIYGTYFNGKASFGALDPVLFPEKSEEPFVFPSLNLVVEDARALLETDFGPVGVKAEGHGNLQSGFSGIIAAIAPTLEEDSCSLNDGSIYGKIGVDAERPWFRGTIRADEANCPDLEFKISEPSAGLDLRIDRTLKGAEGNLDFAGGNVSRAEFTAAKSLAKLRLSWREGRISADYRARISDVVSPAVLASSLTAEGVVRARSSFARLEIDGTVDGEGIRPGRDGDKLLHDSADNLSGTFAAPLLVKLNKALRSELGEGRFSAELTFRKTGDLISLVIPNGSLRGTSGQQIVALSRLQLASDGQAPAHISGNLATGGVDLPRISARVERQPDGSVIANLRMANYEAGRNSVSVPDFKLRQMRSGPAMFEGRILASGDLPGGEVRQLDLPVNGNWSAQSGLELWRNCAIVRFDRLVYSDLTLARRSLNLCPAAGKAILAVGGSGLKLAAGTEDLDLQGRLGETRLALKAQSFGFAYPGVLHARGVDVTLGEGEGVSRFNLPELTAKLDSEPGGSFSDAEARLAAVPLDVTAGKGEWSYSGGELKLSNASFLLADREQVDRFEPLTARDAWLRLADNRIVADVDLRERKSNRVVTKAIITHDLSSGRGRADLLVNDLTFDESLQPEMVTYLALGVVANTRGTINGRGVIDWNADGVTSSGRFSTESLDFAAAFGPVQGVSGTIEFTDLLGMVTAPSQVVRMRSMNPGIEVNDGLITYQLLAGSRLQIDGGKWPFLGGSLILQPALIDLGDGAERRFTLELDGLDAAQFVQRMELANLAATGTFDGVIPLMFNKDGGFIENGMLSAREPGGNLSYIGELTYADLPAMGKFAFNSLKSLDYRRMDVGMNGSLAGEIVTRVSFDGIRQGSDVSRNFITKKIAKLPIRFNVNIRAPFYKLITSVRSMYDPAFIRDPREVGLIDEQGKARQRKSGVQTPVLKPEDLAPDVNPVQKSESE